MKKSAKLGLICLWVMTVLNGCETYSHVRGCKAFIYKPLKDSPAYVVKLPLNSNIKIIIRGHSDCNTFTTYHDAIFYISEEYPYKSHDTLYNFLLKTQHLYQSGERINIPSAGVLYECGGHDSTFWKYCLIYNLEKPDHLYGVSNSGFEHLYVGYTYASERDTAALNDCISSAIRVEKPVKKHKANRIIKHYKCSEK